MIFIFLGLDIISLGYFSLVISMYGYDLLSLSIMLYLGEYFFIRFISNNNDSTSVDVTMYSKSSMF